MVRGRRPARNPLSGAPSGQPLGPPFYLSGVMDTIGGSHGPSFIYLPIVYLDDCQVVDCALRWEVTPTECLRGLYRVPQGLSGDCLGRPLPSDPQIGVAGTHYLQIPLLTWPNGSHWCAVGGGVERPWAAKSGQTDLCNELTSRFTAGTQANAVLLRRQLQGFPRREAGRSSTRRLKMTKSRSSSGSWRWISSRSSWCAGAGNGVAHPRRHADPPVQRPDLRRV